jgi:kinesin family member 15
MDQRKTDLLEAQLLVEQLEQREQMLEAQIEMLQVQKILLRQRTSLSKTHCTVQLTT